VKKAIALFGFVVLCILIAGVFGIVHDQITYSISNEYFTHFKFPQFQIPEYFAKYERIGVSIVGWNATWWTGLLIGIIVGILGIGKPNYSQYFRLKFNSILTIFICTLLFSVIGFIWSKIMFSQIEDWPMNIGGGPNSPELLEILQDQTKLENFFTVGLIHNFSYLGGVIGLIVATIRSYSKMKNLITKPINNSSML